MEVNLDQQGGRSGRRVCCRKEEEMRSAKEFVVTGTLGEFAARASQ